MHILVLCSCFTATCFHTFFSSEKCPLKVSFQVGSQVGADLDPLDVESVRVRSLVKENRNVVDPIDESI